MPVLFDNIPGNIRVPFFYAEFRSGGTPYQQNARLLLVGQKLAAGSAPADQPLLVSDGQEDGLFGSGSMLSQMYKKARRNAPLQEIWALPVVDLVGGVAATGTITVSGAPVAIATVLSLYIAGERIRVGVSTSDSATTIAAAIAAAINATTGLPVTATAALAVVTLTARHKGTLGNHIHVEAGPVEVDGPLSSTMLTVVAMANGAGDPDLQTPLTSLGEDEYDWIASPYADATNLGRATDLLGDISGRWSYLQQLYGHYITVHMGTVGELSTLGNSLNSQHVSIFPARKFRTTPWEVVAAVGARAAQHLQDAPELSRPLQSLELVGVKGPRLKTDQLGKASRQTLYFDGVSGYYVHRDGSVRIDRVVTTYQTNVWGDPDWTYLDIETMAQSMFGIRYIRTDITSKHARQALASDNPGRLPHIVTPDDIRNSIIHAYAKLINPLGVFENLDAFKAALVVERSPSDPNRVDVGLKLDHVNQLRIVAVAAINHMQLPQQTLAA